MARFASHYATHGLNKDLWEAVNPAVSIFQAAQVLEVIHCLVRLVPSSPFQAILQLSGRFFNLFLILTLVPDSRLSIGFPLLLTAWTISETTRYIYYAINIFTYVPYLITWARYTLFIIAYPTGLTGELLVLFAAIPTIKQSPYTKLELPNVGNISFYPEIAIYAMVPIFFTAFLNLYLYMFAQRKKVLSAASGKPQAKKQ